MSRGIALRLEQVGKRFGDFQALDGIDLEIVEGEFLTIVGPSGSGKTTMIRLLVGMDEPTTGSIYLGDRVINRVPAHKRPTCMVFQSLALFPHRSVGENIEFPLKIRGEAPEKRRNRAMQLLDLLHLPRSFHAKRIHECSGGERQRVALARALAFNPEILFFDEPLSALDYRLRKTLEKELKDLHRRTGKTFVYITHSLEEAMVMSDRIAIMRQGRIAQIGTADAIYARPVSRFVAEFMGEVNLFTVETTADGGLLATDAPLRFNGAAHPLGPGERATLMVRPEKLRFLAAEAEADCTLEGILDIDFQLGSRIQYEIKVGDRVITVEKLREDRYRGALGDPVRLGFAMDGAYFIREGRT